MGTIKVKKLLTVINIYRKSPTPGRNEAYIFREESEHTDVSLLIINKQYI